MVALSRATVMGIRADLRADAYRAARARPVVAVARTWAQAGSTNGSLFVTPGPWVTIQVIRYTRPLLENGYHKLHPRAQAVARDDWRTAYRDGTTGLIPGMDVITVTATPHVADRRTQDLGACFPAVKAAVDGLVDAGLIPDDTPAHLTEITFRPVVLRSDLGDALELTITAWRTL